MMPIDVARFARLRSSPARLPLVVALRRAVAAIARSHVALRDRRHTRQLLAMSDYMLADIGVDRLDVQRALDSPWHEIPSARIARGRR